MWVSICWANTGRTLREISNCLLASKNSQRLLRRVLMLTEQGNCQVVGCESWALPLEGRARKYRLADRLLVELLAGRHRLRHLCVGFARRFAVGRHRAGCLRILVRTRGYFSEKCHPRFFEGIFRHCSGLAHLGLLISSSFVLRSTYCRAILPILIRGRGGLARRSLV